MKGKTHLNGRHDEDEGEHQSQCNIGMSSRMTHKIYRTTKF